MVCSAQSDVTIYIVVGQPLHQLTYYRYEGVHKFCTHVMWHAVSWHCTAQHAKILAVGTSSGHARNMSDLG